MKRFYIPNVLRDKISEGGGAVMDDAEFQGKVLAGVKTLTDDFAVQKTKQETLLSDVSRLSTETKTVLEDITKLKKVANDQQSNHDLMVRRLTQFDALIKREMRYAFGDPIKRIMSDDKMRAQVNYLVRAACSNGNDKVSKANEIILKALGEDTSPGSTVIDDQLAAELYDTLSTFGVWNTFGVRRVSTKQTKYPVKTARPIALFQLTESGTNADDTNKAGTSVTLEVEVIVCLLNVSLQLLEDAEIDVTADVLNDFAEAYANRLDHAAVAAAGAANSTDGSQTGILSGGTAAAAGAGNSTTETTDFEDWTRCLLTVDPIVLNRASKWWIHPQHLVRSLSVKDANGRPIFLTALEAPAAGSIGTILGYPVIPAFIMPTTNAATAKVAAFGDPESQVVGVRRDFVFEASDHFRWNALDRSFRGWGRAGVKIRRATGIAYLQLTA